MVRVNAKLTGGNCEVGGGQQEEKVRSRWDAPRTSSKLGKARRDAAGVAQDLGSASLGKDKEVAGNIGQCARSLQCLEPQESLHI